MRTVYKRHNNLYVKIGELFQELYLNNKFTCLNAVDIIVNSLVDYLIKEYDVEEEIFIEDHSTDEACLELANILHSLFKFYENVEVAVLKNVCKQVFITRQEKLKKKCSGCGAVLPKGVVGELCSSCKYEKDLIYSASNGISDFKEVVDMLSAREFNSLEDIDNSLKLITSAYVNLVNTTTASMSGEYNSHISPTLTDLYIKMNSMLISREFNRNEDKGKVIMLSV